MQLKAYSRQIPCSLQCSSPRLPKTNSTMNCGQRAERRTMQRNNSGLNHTTQNYLRYLVNQNQYILLTQPNPNLIKEMVYWGISLAGYPNSMGENGEYMYISMDLISRCHAICLSTGCFNRKKEKNYCNRRSVCTLFHIVLFVLLAKVRNLVAYKNYTHIPMYVTRPLQHESL